MRLLALGPARGFSAFGPLPATPLADSRSYVTSVRSPLEDLAAIRPTALELSGRSSQRPARELSIRARGQMRPPGPRLVEPCESWSSRTPAPLPERIL